jgi:uncharacterized membrane protein YbjE (DUF340 family)
MFSPILIVFVSGMALGATLGRRYHPPHSEEAAMALAGFLLFITGLSLGSSWLSTVATSLLPLSVLMALLTMAMSLAISLMLWRSAR